MPLAAHSCPRSDPHSYQAWVLGGAAALVPLVLQKTLKGLSLIAASGLLVLCVGLATVTASGVIQFGGFPPFPSPLAAPPSPSGFAAFLPSSPDDGQQAQSPRPRQQAPSQAQQASDRQQPIGVERPFHGVGRAREHQARSGAQAAGRAGICAAPSGARLGQQQPAKMRAGVGQPSL